MRRAALVAVALGIAGASFLMGAWVNHWKSVGAGRENGRKILYYVDPMNPSHTQPGPGLAPCGMKMEPVYADEAASAPPGGGPVLPGTVKLSLEKQQLIGVRRGQAEKKSVRHTLRLLGKVAVDETRSYQVTAPAEGWVAATMPMAAGSRVKKDETLATFYSPTFISAGQAFRAALEYQDRMQTNAAERSLQRPGLAEFNVKQYRDSLRNLGVSDRQIDGMIQTRRYSEHIDIVAPADGFILTRNVSQGQRFEKGYELFRIVDLERVWIQVDVFNRDAPLVPPGVEARVSVPAQDLSLPARLSQALPQFDSVTRTLKLRFEADNPHYALKPDMFVDVEFAVTLPETLVVPAEAVLDSGLRKTVFVDRGEGYFEPRTIETGWRLGDYVQVLHGLMDAEPIVVSGNFLLDSESRMKLAAAGVHGMPEIDPVCGMAVDETKARAAGLVLVHEMKNWFFCNEGCKEEFTDYPARFLQPKGTVVAHLPMASVGAVDPVCNMKVDEAKARLGGRLTEHGGQTIYFCNPACKEKFDREPAKYMPAAQSDQQARDGKALDPVCGMWVTEAKARAAGRHSNYHGKTYFFCNDACKEEFDANPKQFLKEGAGH